MAPLSALPMTVSLAAAAAWTATAAASSPITEGYLDHESLVRAIEDLASSDQRCAVEVIGSSRKGRALLMLTLGGSSDPETVKPAFLVTAGLDGRHLVGTETALRVARRLLEADDGSLLDEMTFYIVPRVNPDAAEVNLGPVAGGRIGTARAIDEDFDGAADEDGPADLDGDGVITTMRRANPPLDDEATHLADPAAPRLLKKANAAKGETAVYAVYPEGLDADGDGLIAEDGPGAVDLDRNFMHRWPEYAIDAGPHQISEPESAMLARFVIAHRNIVAAVTYGRHDNLIKVPAGKEKDVTGEAPVDLDADDVALYTEISKKFKEITGQERAPKEDTAGSFAAWLYAQRGIPSFATVVWGRPDPAADEEGPDEPAGDDPAASDAEISETQPADASEDPPAAEDEGEEQEKEEGKKKEDAKPSDEEAAAWLAYSDRDRGGVGFVEWAPFDHPTLGAVEIGGFVPGFTMNPPAAELDELAGTQADFLVELAAQRPRLSIEGPEVERLADGLYEIRIGLVNDGFLPTATAMARRAQSIPPTIVRLSAKLEDIVAGERVTRFWGIDGSGTREVVTWIVRARPGAALEIRVVNRQLGDRVVRVVAPGS